MIDAVTEHRPLHTRIARPALALGAGTLVALSMPPWGFWPLAILGVILFEIALGEVPSRRQRRARDALVQGPRGAVLVRLVRGGDVGQVDSARLTTMRFAVEPSG